MIWTALVALIKGALGLLDALLPDWTPIDFGALLQPVASLFTASHVADFLAWLDQYAPVHEAITIGLLALTLYGTALVYRGAIWVGTKLHILGGAA